MREPTEFEVKFSKLLQEGDKDGARAHIASGKESDLKALNRVPKTRAIVLMEGQANDVNMAAVAPKYVKMTTEQMEEALLELVENYKSTGKADVLSTKKKKKKGKKRGLKPGGGPPKDDEGQEEEKASDEGAGEDEGAEEKTDGGEKREDGSETPEGGEELPESALAGSINLSAVQELLEGVKKGVDTSLADVDEKMGELLINVSALSKAYSSKGGQEKRVSENLERIEGKIDKLHVLYDQQGYMIEALSLIGSNIMDCSPDEFHKAVLSMIEDRAEERKKQLSKEGEGEDAADSGEKS